MSRSLPKHDADALNGHAQSLSDDALDRAIDRSIHAWNAVHEMSEALGYGSAHGLALDCATSVNHFRITLLSEKTRRQSEVR